MDSFHQAVSLRTEGHCLGMLVVQLVAQGSPQGGGEPWSDVMTAGMPNLFNQPCNKAFTQFNVVAAVIGIASGQGGDSVNSCERMGEAPGQGRGFTKSMWMWLNFPVGTSQYVYKYKFNSAHTECKLTQFPAY